MQDAAYHHAPCFTSTKLTSCERSLSRGHEVPQLRGLIFIFSWRDGVLFLLVTTEEAHLVTERLDAELKLCLTIPAARHSLTEMSKRVIGTQCRSPFVREHLQSGRPVLIQQGLRRRVCKPNSGSCSSTTISSRKRHHSLCHFMENMGSELFACLSASPCHSIPLAPLCNSTRLQVLHTCSAIMARIRSQYSRAHLLYYSARRRNYCNKYYAMQYDKVWW